MYTSINEFAKAQSTYKIIAKYNGCLAVEANGYRSFIIFEQDLQKLAAEQFSKANLMNGYFRGTAIIGKKEQNKKRSTTDYSSPFHTGQVIPSKEENEEFSEDEEFDFTYDSKMSSDVINKLLDKVIPTQYVKGTVVKKLYLG